MFSSSNNTTNNNPFLPSSLILGHNSIADDIFHHHRQDLLGPHFGDTHNINMLLSNTISSTTSKRSSVKKDRHSKICTAQGVRDRRVRLSIQIARKFFDLQDMLGFDKASKTLEWLFSKSTTAIMELTHSTNNNNNNNNKQSLFSTASEESPEEAEEKENPLKMKMKMKMKSLKKKNMKQPSASQLLAKEVRAKARARARARTREKMCSRRLDDWKKFLDASPLMLNQYLRSSTQCSSPHNILSSNVHSIPNQVERNYFVDEPIMIKRKLSKPASAFGNNHQNLLISSKDVTSNSNSNNDLPPNLHQNWGTGSSIGRASFCAMNNMSLSTELQIFGEHYETHNNQSLH